MCPHCGRDAPVVYRGVVAYCTACNAPRPPLTGKSLHLAGQPSRVGGVLASVAGWLFVAGGLAVAMLFGGLAQLLFHGLAWLVVGAPFVLVSAIVGLSLVRGGAHLRAKGVGAERAVRVQAVHAFASTRGGAVDAPSVARSLDIPVAEADALLASMAREEDVSVDVDPNGTLVYRFLAGESPRVRVDAEIARSPNRAEWERLEAAEAEARGRNRRAR